MSFYSHRIKIVYRINDENLYDIVYSISNTLLKDYHMNGMRYAAGLGRQLAGGLRPTLGRDLTAQRGHTPASTQSKYDWRGRILTSGSNQQAKKALALIREHQQSSPYKMFMMQYSTQQSNIAVEKQVSFQK